MTVPPVVAAIGAGALLLLSGSSALAQPFRLAPERPDIDRWMYPFNSTPGTRPVAAVFSTFGDESGVDTRHGQFILAWNTQPAIPSGLPAERYLIRSIRLTVTVTRGDVFVNDSTADPYESLLFPDDPAYKPDPDPGRPLELFGTGFRGGFTAATFQANSPFGGAAIGRRNAFAAGFAPDGQLVDVGNNVGKTNALFPHFPSRAFATGSIPAVGAGQPVPAGSQIVFDLDLGDPLVLGYVRDGLREGRLWTTITWLGGSEGFIGAPTFPEIATAENLLYDPPRLVVEGTVVGTQDTDAPILRQTLDAQGRLILSWPGLANHRDTLETSVDLIRWEPVPGPLDHRERGLIRWMHDADADSMFRGYRVRREAVP